MRFDRKSKTQTIIDRDGMGSDVAFRPSHCLVLCVNLKMRLRDPIGDQVLRRDKMGEWTNQGSVPITRERSFP